MRPMALVAPGFEEEFVCGLCFWGSVRLCDDREVASVFDEEEDLCIFLCV